VIYEIRLHADIPGEKIGKKLLSELWVLVKECDHRLLFDADYRALLVGAGPVHTKRLTRQATLSEKTVLRQNGNHRFFTTLRYHHKFYLAALDVEDSIRRVSLQKDQFINPCIPGEFFRRRVS
jgi:hypothetical protein